MDPVESAKGFRVRAGFFQADDLPGIGVARRVADPVLMREMRASYRDRFVSGHDLDVF